MRILSCGVSEGMHPYGVLERYHDLVIFGFKVEVIFRSVNYNIKIKDEVMNWKDIASAGKSISRVDSLELHKSTRDGLEAVMVMKAASSRPQEMALIAQTLEKVNTQADLKQVAADLGTLVQAMKAKEAPEPVEDTVTMTKAQFNELKAELSK